MQTLLDAAGGITKASKISGVSLETLGHWRDGRSRPAFFTLAELCELTGISMQWLATGRGTARPESDEDHKGRQTAVSGLLFGSVDTGRLDDAFREALTRSGIQPDELGDTTALMLLTVLLYDAAVKASEAAKSVPLGHSREKEGSP